MVDAARLPVEDKASAVEMAEAIFGDGVTVVGASYTGDDKSSGVYTDGLATSPGVAPGDSGVILSTGRVRDFTRNSGEANQAANTSTDTGGVNGNAQFDAAAGTSTYDASFLDVDFIPDNSVMTMQFVFSSEEYPEFQTSVFQDFVGVWVNGTQATLEIGDGSSDPDSINGASNQNLYNDNTASDFNTEMDGFTLTLSLTMFVNPGVVNSIRIGIADVTDSIYDSNLLIAADSVQTELVAMTDFVTTFPTGSRAVDILGNDINNGGGTLTVTHLNGQPVVAGSVVTLATGQSVRLNADGTIDVISDGEVEDFNFTYTIDNGTNTDVGFVNVATIPCFVAGTLIRTPDGEVPVEELAAGDLVMTCDDGPCPVRWAGRRHVAAQGGFAPIHIRAGTFGNHRDLFVSPQHRVLVRDRLAELLFGECEVLIAARDLVDGHAVTRQDGGTVTYVHLMFDRHQLIYSQGLASESFLPGPQTTRMFPQADIDEIRRIFPDLDPATGAGYGPAARRLLRRYEAELLLGQARAA